MIGGLHHNAYRCRDSEETRAFYEDFLGLKLAHALRIGESRTGRSVQALHTFFELGDGSFLAFFEVPEMPFEFKKQHDFDLHIALASDDATMDAMVAKARAAGQEVRGPVDHGFIRSIYLRDPNGYGGQLPAPNDAAEEPPRSAARDVLAAWQADKPRA
jgi:catechol 2,3-dioxygenase-like lactoylglutathione lyase family enzyme